MHNQVCRFFVAIGFCLTASLAQAAGLRSIDIPADTNGPANQCHANSTPTCSRSSVQGWSGQ